ncbi:methyl-accepting chemotaxis protein [Paenibacillus sp. sgz302251]|uniref:methyl-accepting chemotaxis protein n=1 Tax=Paenibacillus sp. sgz302251 TaxID=3414493 RepID=UPI003C7D82FB
MRLKSIGTKISLIIIAVLLVFSVVIVRVVIDQVEQGIKRYAIEKARGDLELGNQVLTYKYPGKWNIREGKLFKGDTKINDNFGVVDEIGELTGDTVTIFQGNTRVTTNVMIDGKRAIGTTVSDEVSTLVLEKGENYYGEAVVVGQTYQTAYMPIKDGEGEVLGIFYVGAPQSLIDDIISSFVQRFSMVFIIALVITVGLIVLYIRKMMTRLKRISKAMDHAGSGDFTSHLYDRSKDEIGQLNASFNQMRESLRELIEQGVGASDKVSETTQQLAVVAQKTAKDSEHIAASMQQVASGAENQTESTSQNLRAVEEVAVGIQSIAESASEISESSIFSKQRAETGANYVEQTVQQMASIHASVHETDQVIKQLEGKSLEIGGILNTIRNIAAQTNILALNAAIEASRAGEQGKGFAVVAAEVRKLAEQTGQSSDQINELLHEISAGMKQSIVSIDHVKQEVQTGITLTEQTDRNLSEIVQSNSQIAEQIETLAATAEQMSASVEEITASVNEIAQIAKLTSTSSYQVAAATTEQLATVDKITDSASFLSQVSTELRTVLGKFKI